MPPCWMLPQPAASCAGAPPLLADLQHGGDDVVPRLGLVQGGGSQGHERHGEGLDALDLPRRGKCTGGGLQRGQRRTLGQGAQPWAVYANCMCMGCPSSSSDAQPRHLLPPDLKKGIHDGRQRTCHSHSAAMAIASARLGTMSGCRAGVRSTRWSSMTW